MPSLEKRYFNVNRREMFVTLVAALTTDEMASDAARAEVRAALARAAADRLSTPAFARPKRYAVD